MKINDIAAILGISRSAVSNVINGRGDKHSESTVSKVNFLRNTETNYIDDKVGNVMFNELCLYVISRCKDVEVCKVAYYGKSWFNYLNNNRSNISELSSLGSSAIQIFKDSHFPELCNYVLSKSNNNELRNLAVELLNISLKLVKH